jgi:hypothetical protein
MNFKKTGLLFGPFFTQVKSLCYGFTFLVVFSFAES